MVIRKPFRNGSAESSHLSPPYPTTPLDPEPPFLETEIEEESSSWDGEANRLASTTASREELPRPLRVGPNGELPKIPLESLKLASSTASSPRNNGAGLSESGNSTDAYAGSEMSRLSEKAPPTLVFKDTQPPSQQMSALSFTEPGTNPWKPVVYNPALQSHPIFPNSNRQAGNNALSPNREPPPAPPLDISQSVLVHHEGDKSLAFDEDEPSPAMHEMPTDTLLESKPIHKNSHLSDHSQVHSAKKPGEILPQGDSAQQGEDRDLIDRDQTPSELQQSGIVRVDAITEENASISDEQPPALPPRRAIHENPSPQPPRPIINGNRSTSSDNRKQKKETYEIKKISWQDVTASENPRITPILVQNANGPCPLLALVNALTLSTPADVQTALVETLRSREQVSLGLLLDAVFDELMSGRRGDAAQELPDVSDLYSFLITLHTGMNVNPRFFASSAANSMSNHGNSTISVLGQEKFAPGSFEETREMRLYSTFAIPLIHGWIPDRESPAYAALWRSAKTYEDAQNIMFQEEILEDKLGRDGLTVEEQSLLEDIMAINAFFASYATQLTPYGLQAITTSLSPGAVAILFRNDHFSTLYRHPETLQLLQLVTDMGYAGHEEVVWESLNDVTGENAEFFSGDFRLVGGASPPCDETSNCQELAQQSIPIPPKPNEPPQLPKTEQEDHDLALALQLQEEEEERHRSEIARRRRETELSQQYIEQQGAQAPIPHRGNYSGARQARRTPGTIAPCGNPDIGPAIPPRRNSNLPTTVPQPPNHDPEVGADAPPPSYEMAATQQAYMPPEDHPSHPNASSTLSQGPSLGPRRGSLQPPSPNSNHPNSGRASTMNQIPAPSSGLGIGAGRRIAGSRPVASALQDRDRDCIVM